MKLNKKEKEFISDFKNQFNFKNELKEHREFFEKNASSIVVIIFVVILILSW
jgi:hypothetical protein